MLIKRSSSVSMTKDDGAGPPSTVYNSPPPRQPPLATQYNVTPYNIDNLICSPINQRVPWTGLLSTETGICFFHVMLAPLLVR